MLDLLSSIFAGGVTGIIGSALTLVGDLFKAREQRKADEARRKHDLAMMDKEYQYRERQASIESDTRQAEADAGTLAASYAHDRAVYATVDGPWYLRLLLVGVDVARGLVRPCLTVFLIWLVWDLRTEVKGILTSAGLQGLTAGDALGIYRDVAEMILYLAATCVTWWFGTRFKGSKTK
ncbi:hypothetical protein PCS_02612 [Desulfocurvibacter africanus PCS]|uniref:Uncharacterized protein n=1 Tax=Desulfocurvibacter africanus PCS TaxID=1262666 RepID=M5PRB1_DESAF|nr:hypothetical protein [Desulfocurvibacter africanus]EMG36600.1 hypothetical protein PCS_02612 [Desulfocurvibacter africanus PCS]